MTFKFKFLSNSSFVLKKIPPKCGIPPWHHVASWGTIPEESEEFLDQGRPFGSDERSLGVIYKSLVIGTPESSKITGLVVDLSRDFFGLKQKLCCINVVVNYL